MLRWIVVLLVMLQGVALAHDKFPMTGGDYRKRLGEKLVRYRDRLESRMQEHQLAAPKREAARRRLAGIEAELKKIAERIAADGTVTETEAAEVKTRGKQLRDALYRDLGFERGKGE